MKHENKYQERLMSHLRNDIFNSYGNDVKIFKSSSYAPQGWPDITIIHKSGRWAFLEAKKSQNEPHQPNQDWYVDLLDNWGFAAFIYPENENEVIDELVRYLSW